MGATIEGLDELKVKLGQVKQAAAGEISQALLAGGYVLEGAVKVDMALQKTGRMYGKHQASAPGESPAMDTGDLAASIMTEVDGDAVLVGTNAEYAEPLEFGTARMAARPFMRPALEANRDGIEEAARSVLRRLLAEIADV